MPPNLAAGNSTNKAVIRDCEISPLILQFILMVIAIAAMAAQSPPSRAAAIHQHLHQAEAYLRANDARAAAKEFEAVLTLDPKNAEAYANLGVIAFFQRDYQKASQNFRKALAIDPSLAKTQALLGISLERLGDASAGALLEKSFAKLQDKQLRVKVGIELANLYQQRGETERAVGAVAGPPRPPDRCDPVRSVPAPGAFRRSRGRMRRRVTGQPEHRAKPA